VSNSGTFFSNCLTIAVATSLSLPSAVASGLSSPNTSSIVWICYLVELGPRIVNRRNRTLIPIVRERDATATPPNLLRNNFESRAYSIWLANGTVPAFTAAMVDAIFSSMTTAPAQGRARETESAKQWDRFSSLWIRSSPVRP
jgi:hypothetical protein